MISSLFNETLCLLSDSDMLHIDIYTQVKITIVFYATGKRAKISEVI